VRREVPSYPVIAADVYALIKVTVPDNLIPTAT